ncbi:MAG: energy transducer TonB [Aquaticitalea sp.]
MKKLHNTDEMVDLGTEVRESSKKHDVNLKNNSSLYFQIGLILCLLASYGLFQMEFEKSTPYFAYGPSIDDTNVYFVREAPPVQEEPQKERQPERKVAVLSVVDPVIKDNDAVIDAPDVVVDVVIPDLPVVPTPNKNPPIIDIPKDYNMDNVEIVPVFPGCESAKNNKERMDCMSEQMAKLIQRRFNTDVAQDLGLKGVQKIQVQFKIDATGQVTDIKTRSPYSQLEKEAERVVGKIPVMKPGMQRDTPVAVVYNLPIAFQVE